VRFSSDHPDKGRVDIVGLYWNLEYQQLGNRIQVDPITLD